MPMIAPENPEVCETGQEPTYEALLDIADILEDIAKDVSIDLTEDIRSQLKKSSLILSGVATFIKQLNESFDKFNQPCAADKQYNIEAISALSDMMDNMADLFLVLGESEKAEQLREKKGINDRIVVSTNIFHLYNTVIVNCLFPTGGSPAVQLQPQLPGV